MRMASMQHKGHIMRMASMQHKGHIMRMASHHSQQRWCTALLVLLAAAAVCTQPAACKRLPRKYYHSLERLTILGDSNSDAGNASFATYSFFKQTGTPDPTYDIGGRFSGGLVWTDYVNQCISVVRSYAVGFGTMCEANGFRTLNPSFPDVPVISVEDQVAAYIKVKRKPHTRATLLWAGPNDIAVAFFNDPDGPTGPHPSYLETHTDEVLNGVIDCTINNILKLIKHGERNFIVVNIQPLQLSWFVRNLDQAAPGLAAKLGGYITTFNKRLAKRLGHLHLPASVKVDLLDIYKPIKDALTGAKPVPGITDLANRCLPIRDTFGLLEIPTPLVGPVCSNPLELANWDSTHLNTVVHKEVIAKTVIKFLKRKKYISGCKH